VRTVPLAASRFCDGRSSGAHAHYTANLRRIERRHVPSGATANGTTDREAGAGVGVRSAPTSKLEYDDRGLTSRCAWSTPPVALTA
jgi:hypothetical protein